jgi:hypothetical protein
MYDNRHQENIIFFITLFRQNLPAESAKLLPFMVPDADIPLQTCVFVMRGDTLQTYRETLTVGHPNPSIGASSVQR